jgi:hypothetical protein
LVDVGWVAVATDIPPEGLRQRGTSPRAPALEHWLLKNEQVGDGCVPRHPLQKGLIGVEVNVSWFWLAGLSSYFTGLCFWFPPFQGGLGGITPSPYTILTHITQLQTENRKLSTFSYLTCSDRFGSIALGTGCFIT